MSRILDDRTVISTWFVSDDADNATYFPQVEAKSNDPGAQAAYWRCIATFFASSIVVNPDATHRFYTNTDLVDVDGFPLQSALHEWGVEIVRLPITYRLAPGATQMWGNQFYIFDIVDFIAKEAGASRHIVLDSDCIWTGHFAPIECAIVKHGLLTYDVYGPDNSEDRPINGTSERELKLFLASVVGTEVARVRYCGGEIFAADRNAIERIAACQREFWNSAVEALRTGRPSPREEAHLLSVIYAALGAGIGTAQPFIKRMWTGIKYTNIVAGDESFPIWHLPAEKKTGLKRLFDCLARSGLTQRELIDAGFRNEIYSSLFGVPVRTWAKYSRDAVQLGRIKIAAKLSALF